MRINEFNQFLSSRKTTMNTLSSADNYKRKFGAVFTPSKWANKLVEKHFFKGDIFFQEKEIKTDLLIGNPPWVNFSDLEETYKEKTKHLYIHYGLVKNPKDLLLGNARTDIATLVVAKVLHSNLNENGKAIFFLPLSIFQNDGANQEF